jgi:hypothetical protein
MKTRLHLCNETDNAVNADTEVDEQHLEAEIKLGEQPEQDKRAQLGRDLNAGLDNDLSI